MDNTDAPNMDQCDELSRIPLRRADTRDSFVIEVGTTQETSHRLSKSRDGYPRTPVWLQGTDTEITAQGIRALVAERLRKNERDLMWADVWRSLDIEIKWREKREQVLGEIYGTPEAS